MTSLSRSIRRWFALLLLLSPFTILAEAARAETANIHLLDGSTIRGEVVSLKGGSYKIQTPALGELNIPQSKVRSIEYGASASTNSSRANSVQPSPTPGASSAQLAAIASQLQNSPTLLSDVQALSNDPAIMAIVQDPEIQQLIASGDYLGLMQNPKMQQLMNNSKIRDLTNKLK